MKILLELEADDRLTAEKVIDAVQEGLTGLEVGIARWEEKS